MVEVVVVYSSNIYKNQNSLLFLISAFFLLPFVLVDCCEIHPGYYVPQINSLSAVATQVIFCSICCHNHSQQGSQSLYNGECLARPTLPSLKGPLPLTKKKILLWEDWWENWYGIPLCRTIYSTPHPHQRNTLPLLH